MRTIATRVALEESVFGTDSKLRRIWDEYDQEVNKCRGKLCEFCVASNAHMDRRRRTGAYASRVYSVGWLNHGGKIVPESLQKQRSLRGTGLSSRASEKEYTRDAYATLLGDVRALRIKSRSKTTRTREFRELCSPENEQFFLNPALTNRHSGLSRLALI
jgi:hypothetical protein